MAGADVARLQVRVQPGARRSQIMGIDEGVVRVRIAAPPVEGKANAALCAVLAEALGVRPHAVTLVRGATGRLKLVEVVGLTAEAALARLRAAAAG